MLNSIFTKLFSFIIACLLLISFTSALTVSAEVKDTSFYFAGYTAPNSFVVFRENNVIIGTTSSDANGYFSKSIFVVVAGIHNIEIWSSDIDGMETDIINFMLLVLPKQEMALTNIYLPATMAISDTNITDYENINIKGYAKPNTNMQITLDGDTDFIIPITTDSNGAYSIILLSENYPNGIYQVYSELLIIGIIDNSTISNNIEVNINNIAKAKPSVSIIIPTITTLPTTGSFWEQFNLSNLFNSISAKLSELNNKAVSYFIILYEHGYCTCCCLILIPALYIYLIIFKKRKASNKKQKNTRTP